MSTRLAVIAGDGIGPEVVDVGLEVLHAVLPGVETTPYDLGAAAYHRTGEALPDSVLAELRGHDAILLGAVGDPSVPPGVLERGLLLRLRFALDHHVNLRPCGLFEGVTSPLGDKAIDMVVVREGTEGPYVATAAGCARGRRTRWRPRSASTPPTAWSAWCGRRSGARRRGAGT
jgi:3-isopropylmalate dehydrogenase